MMLHDMEVNSVIIGSLMLSEYGTNGLNQVMRVN